MYFMPLHKLYIFSLKLHEFVEKFILMESRRANLVEGGRHLPGSYRLLVSIVLLSVFQGAYAIDMHFAASDGSGSVGIWDHDDVDDEIEVSGTSSASFNGGVSMTDSKSLSGSGDANINQVMFGSGGGADYVINYALETFGASTIEGSGSSSLTPVAGSASRSVSTTGTTLMTSELSGTQGGDFAAVWSHGKLADVSTSQSVATGQSVTASQNMNAEGYNYAAAEGYAKDAEGNYVVIYAISQLGTLDTSQGVETTNSAAGHQKTVTNGCVAYAFCKAYNPDQNYYAYLGNIIGGVVGPAYLDFEGSASVGASEARAYQRSYAEGDDIWPWARSRGKLEQRVWTGTKLSESWAWTNDTDDGAVIVEL